MILAIDTATRLMSLAVHDGYRLLAEETWHTPNNHTAELAPAIRSLLARCETELADVTALAVSIGPGSFTGVRIGVAFAKGLAAAQQVPLVGVSTLDTLAAAQPQYPRYGLVTVIEAGRGRIIAGTYRWGKGEWVQRGEPRLMDWETLLATLDGPAYITGDIDEQGHALLDGMQTGEMTVRVAPSALRLRRAGFLAEVALERLKSGSGNFDSAHVAPLYVQTRDVP